MEQDTTYEVKFGRTTFVVTPKFSGTKTLEEVLKTALKHRIETEAMEKRYEQ